MHDDIRNLSLTFPAIPVSKGETPPDFKRLLYKGGPSFPVEEVDKAIMQGKLGDVVPERVELVRLIHEFIAGLLVSGGSPVTARGQIKMVISLFAWADKSGSALSLSEVLTTYLEWSEYLLHRARVGKKLKEDTAYGYARVCGQVLDGVLERGMPMVTLTRLKKSRSRKRPQGAVADKQNLQGTFAFGRMLQDICDGTPLEVVWGPRPVSFPRQDGGEIVLGRSGRPANSAEKRLPSNMRKSVEAALVFEADRSLDHKERKSVANLRIQAEMLMFMGQTGMGLTETIKLPLHRFSYESDTNGYKVLDYKRRAGGQVLFRIFGEYRGHFERYLEWRRGLFPGTEQRLFPLIRAEGIRETLRPDFHPIQQVCKQVGIPWTPPSMLRRTRVNWCLRRSGDPEMTAEMAQHTERMLLEVYAIPSQQRAISEITIFWARNDPALAGKEPLLAVAPGECDGTPVAFPAKPKFTPEPDCISPSGCLWCTHHRDIDSFDYVWSLACFKHLKIIELSNHCPPPSERQVTHPAEHVIQRASEKLTSFRDSNDKRREWVEEALARVDEGNYHNQWSYLIETMEGSFK